MWSAAPSRLWGAEASRPDSCWQSGLPERAERARKLSDGGGLYVLIAPNGGRYWRFHYRYAGKQKTLALGVYPAVGLAKARERHQEARRLLAEDIDPSAERKTNKTFEEVARAWHAHWKSSRHERHAHYVLKRLEADVFPEVGSRRLGESRTSAFRDVARKIEQRGAADIAKRVLQTCGKIMRYAMANDLATHKPVSGIKPGDVLKPRTRRNYPRIDQNELPKLLKAIDAYMGADHSPHLRARQKNARQLTHSHAVRCLS